MIKNKTTLLIAGALLLLVTFLTAYTLFLTDSFSSTDREVEKLTESQMSTILLSVNQYAEDVVTNVYTRINLISATAVSGEKASELLQTLSRESGYITSILIADSVSAVQGDAEYITSGSQLKKGKILLANGDYSPIKRLFTYAANGYMKIENTVISADSAAFYFLIKNRTAGYSFYYISFNPMAFVLSNLQQKISDLAGDQFSVELSSQKFGALIPGSPSTGSRLTARAPFRMLNDYELTITPSGNTLALTIQERSRFNLYLIMLVNVLLVGGVFVFWYILRREMKLAQLKTDFVANVSHELRTPLSLISMFSESLLLGRVKNEAKQKEYFSIIQSETGRLSGLVNRILNFSQLDAGRKKFVMEEFDLKEMLQRVYHTYEYHLSQKGFTSSLHVPEEETQVHADKSAIEEVCINLIDNAMKYSSDIKVVNVSLECKEGFAVFSVSDKGVGISPEDQKHIFDKFFRAGSSLIHTTKGTGLGLSIVKQIIDVHQGKVNVSSQPGQGSTFSVWLPINAGK